MKPQLLQICIILARNGHQKSTSSYMCVLIGHTYKIGLSRFLPIKMTLMVTVLPVVFFYPQYLTKMQTVQTRIRMVTNEASDPGLECLPKHSPIIRNGLFILYTTLTHH